MVHTASRYAPPTAVGGGLASAGQAEFVSALMG